MITKQKKKTIISLHVTEYFSVLEEIYPLYSNRYTCGKTLDRELNFSPS